MKDQKFNTLIVDDEELARSDLKSVIEPFRQINVVGEADNLTSAKAFLGKNNIDLVFLDIQLGRENGFDLIKFIPSETSIIFVTAFDEYAIRAFEVNAQDYLLKPVMTERLAKTLERLEEKNSTTAAVDEKRLKAGDSIFVRMNNNYEFFNIDQILYLSAFDDYSEVTTIVGHKKLVLKSLKEWENRLPEKLFCRIHRSTIINIAMVERIEPWFNYSYRVYLKTQDKPLIMSRRYFGVIKDKLG
ncbi:MAG: LytTR family DNA-binding domain-containing protein [Bacteroidetes bacterium]|nr:LytTR family DNA-binding domain-containing protein [Bacteroidota bacterium]